jgi:hypothetical protein
VTVSITPDCQRFCARLSSHKAPNGGSLSLRVCQGWTGAETSYGNSGVRGNNFINIGNTDSNPFGGPRWDTPEDGADASFQWLIDNPASGTSILAAAGKPDPDQLVGIYNSPFASSRYRDADAAGNWVGPNGVRLVAAYNALGGPQIPVPGSAPTFVPPIPNSEEEPDVFARSDDPKNGCHILVDPAGEVYAFGADGLPGGHYLGGLNNHPEFQAGGSATNGPAIGAFHYDDGNPILSAYRIWTKDAGGQVHPYGFPSDGSLAH